MMPISASWVWLCVVEPSAFILGENFTKRAVEPGSYLSATFCHAWPRVCACACADTPLLCLMHFWQSHWFLPMPEKADPPFSAAENPEQQAISAASVGSWNLLSLAAGLRSPVWYLAGHPESERRSLQPGTMDSSSRMLALYRKGWVCPDLTKVADPRWALSWSLSLWGKGGVGISNSPPEDWECTLLK